MEARIARLESDVANLRTNMADMTINVRSLGDKMDDMNARFDTKFDATKHSIDDVTEKLSEVKDGLTASISEVRVSVALLEARLIATFENDLAKVAAWGLTLYIALTGAMLGAMARGFGWI